MSRFHPSYMFRICYSICLEFVILCSDFITICSDCVTLFRFYHSLYVEISSLCVCVYIYMFRLCDFVQILSFYMFRFQPSLISSDFLTVCSDFLTLYMFRFHHYKLRFLHSLFVQISSLYKFRFSDYVQIS